ncbi:MAG: ROK family protein [Imperialibacter sp.]|uniref:polyphosphate--glucose phosphotransferase n=1 Tax=Imperialibacter sp. TaxID=2038411 RepID=UPI0032F0433E
MVVLGIDIGGTGMKAAPVDTRTGSFMEDRFRIPTPSPATPDAMIATVKAIVEHFDWKGIIGIGFPAAIKKEIVMTASNIDEKWIGLNAGKAFEMATGCPTHLINDVDAAGLAEVKFGAGKKEKGSVIMVAAGTGIGTSIFYKKRLFPNTELGYIMVNNTFGEHYASASVKEKQELDWEVWGKRFNEYLKRLEFLLWPDLIVVGGGISKKHKEFFRYLDLETKVVPAKLRNNAGIIGAALAAKKELT